jgi:hypothetical protein
MTETELLALPKVGPDEASAFLGGEPTAQYIRLWCKDGDCPFGSAKQQTNERWTFTINRMLLIKYRRGEIPLSVPAAVLRLLESIIAKEDKPA